MLVVLLAIGADHVDEGERRAIPLRRRVNQPRRNLGARQSAMDQTAHGELVYVHRAAHRRRLFVVVAE